MLLSVEMVIIILAISVTSFIQGSHIVPHRSSQQFCEVGKWQGLLIFIL